MPHTVYTEVNHVTVVPQEMNVHATTVLACYYTYIIMNDHHR